MVNADDEKTFCRRFTGEGGQENASKNYADFSLDFGYRLESLVWRADV